MKQVTLLGATGSIGQSTLEILARHPENYGIYALTANTDSNTMAELCRQHRPKYAVMNDDNAGNELRRLIGDSTTEVLPPSDLVTVASEGAVDIVVAGIVGAAGLLPTLQAVKASKRVLLANKESLVMAGELFMQAVREYGARLMPVDSEHNAIFQCLPEDAMQGGLTNSGVERILLTGSGGPFRDRDPSTFGLVTPAEAIDHPNWDMGPKISVDSATMMNKGLELIEACWLFSVDESDIEIVLHRESIIHSMVSFSDGSVLAQMGRPDMRTPIAHALAWPQRIASGVEPLDLVAVSQLNFSRPDSARYPCLDLARQAWRQGQSASVVLNAANEIAVDEFLNGQIMFPEISNLIDSALQKMPVQTVDSIETVLDIDASTRSFCRQLLKG